MRTCRQLSTELSPYLYSQVQLELVDFNDFHSWVDQIGAKNAVLIRSLILKSPSLGTDHSASSWANESAWALALRGLSKLNTLTFHVAHGERAKTRVQKSTRHRSNTPSPDLLNSLSLLAHACSEMQALPNSTGNVDAYLPDNLRSHRFTHAFFSLHEPMPTIFAKYLDKVLLLPRAEQGLSQALLSPSGGVTIETSILGLPPFFFQQNGFHLQDTYAFNENNESANAVWTFTKTMMVRYSPINVLKKMTRELPNLGYLRLGCLDLDSSILIYVPKHLHTLDVAFTDVDAERVADNLMTMRGICRNLFTLAIAVSPLHDRAPDLEDSQEEVFFERHLVSEEVAHKWAPLWKALDEIKASRVKTWEGEGPGFRR